MNKTYSARIENIYFSIINAPDKEHAFDIVSRYILKYDDNFYNYLSNLEFDGALIDQFLANENYNLLDDILFGKIDYQSAYIKSTIYQNLHKFWPDNPNYVEEYYKAWEGFLNSGNSNRLALSYDLILNAAKKVLETNSWYTEFKITEINLNSDHQLIYYN